MIERKFVSQNMKEYRIKQYLFEQLTRAGLSDVKLKRTPLGEKIQVFASRPGLVVGKGGSNISKLTDDLRNKFEMENPQIEIEEVTNPNANAAITAELIANSLERFGSARFKGVGHKALRSVMDAGSLGVEITISGKIPSSRAKTWRFYEGYLKKCGDLSITGVNVAHQAARLKTGIVGITVKIMPGNIVLPDKIELRESPHTIIEEVTAEAEKKKVEAEQKEVKKVKEKAPVKEEKKEKKVPAKKEEKAPVKEEKKVSKKEVEETKKESPKKESADKTESKSKDEEGVKDEAK